MKFRFITTIFALFLVAFGLLSSQYHPLKSHADALPDRPTVTTQVIPPPASAPTSDTAPQTQTQYSSSANSGNPTHISLPQLNISLAVQPGYYDAKRQVWTLSSTTAMFATMTAQPNSAQGNTFIYGHNLPKVFKNLTNATSGTTAIVTTGDNHQFTYKLTTQEDVQPTDVTLFQRTGAPTLTLQTCSGFWQQNRRLLTFRLVEAK